MVLIIILTSFIVIIIIIIVIIVKVTIESKRVFILKNTKSVMNKVEYDPRNKYQIAYSDTRTNLKKNFSKK